MHWTTEHWTAINTAHLVSFIFTFNTMQVSVSQFKIATKSNSQFANRAFISKICDVDKEYLKA